MIEAAPASLLRRELFIQKRTSATQGVPPGRKSHGSVANRATVLWGERDAVLADKFLSDEQTSMLAGFVESKGRTHRTIYLTHANPDHFSASPSC